MPIYEYECLECGAEFEEWGKITEDALEETECPHCEILRPIKRLMSQNSFLLKGSGWNPITDRMPFEPPSEKRIYTKNGKKYKK